MRRKQVPPIITRITNTIKHEHNVHGLTTPQIAKVLQAQQWDVTLGSCMSEYYVRGGRNCKSYVVARKAITMVATKHDQIITRHRNTSMVKLCQMLLNNPYFNTHPLSLSFNEITAF